LAISQVLLAAPQVVVEPQQLVVTGRDYRVTFDRFRSGFQLDLRDGQGRWRPVTRKGTEAEFAVQGSGGVQGSQGAPARVRHESAADRVTVGLVSPLVASPTALARIHC
jgi:hypothetical protein